MDDFLVQRFGREMVFFDIRAIRPGDDIRQVTHTTVCSSTVLLVLIGKGWANARDKAGNLRLQSPTDLVRLELASALRHGLVVIPVLMGGAKMPEADALPSDIREIVFRKALELSDRHFHEDAEVLESAIKEVLRSAA